MGKYDGMTVNERLSEAGLTEAYDRAKSDDDLAKINAILAQVDLQQDENGMNSTLATQDRGTKKTLSVRPETERTEAPALQKKGRGWNIAESRLDTLHDTAREMRRNPTEAQVLLAEALVAAELGKYRFRRQVVIGSAIVDFACHSLKLAVEIDEPDANAEIDRRRDRSLAEVGIKVLRYPAAQVRDDTAGVVQAIIAEMKKNYDERRVRARPANPGRARRDYQR